MIHHTQRSTVGEAEVVADDTDDLTRQLCPFNHLETVHWMLSEQITEKEPVESSLATPREANCNTKS